MNFKKWFATFVEEKNINTEEILEIEGKSGTNFIPVGCVIEAINNAPAHEQSGIKNMLVKIDFANASVVRYFNHLAQALAI